MKIYAFCLLSILTAISGSTAVFASDCGPNVSTRACGLISLVETSEAEMKTEFNALMQCELKLNANGAGAERVKTLKSEQKAFENYLKKSIETDGYVGAVTGRHLRDAEAEEQAKIYSQRSEVLKGRLDACLNPEG